MKITVLFFGVLTETASTSVKVYRDVGTLGDLELRLSDDFPGIRNYEFRISLNGEIVNEDAVLKDGDEIALLPPFAGG